MGGKYLDFLDGRERDNLSSNQETIYPGCSGSHYKEKENMWWTLWCASRPDDRRRRRRGVPDLPNTTTRPSYTCSSLSLFTRERNSPMYIGVCLAILIITLSVKVLVVL